MPTKRELLLVIGWITALTVAVLLSIFIAAPHSDAVVQDASIAKAVAPVFLELNNDACKLSEPTSEVEGGSGSDSEISVRHTGEVNVAFCTCICGGGSPDQIDYYVYRQLMTIDNRKQSPVDRIRRVFQQATAAFAPGEGATDRLQKVRKACVAPIEPFATLPPLTDADYR